MPKTLLLADDSVVIQKLVGLSFANEDIELVTTDNGDDALERVREIGPDLVLADVVMPGKNGYELCEAIKGDPQLSHTPVLLLTGTFEAFDEARARQVGSDGHITKPFEAQGLVDRATELLSRERPAAAAPPQPAAPPAAPPEAALRPATESMPTPTRGSMPDSMPRTALDQPAAPMHSSAAATTPAPDDTYDFFDEDVSELASPMATAPDTSSTDDSFEFGSSELEPLAGAGDDPLSGGDFDSGFDLDPAPADDMTIIAPSIDSPTANDLDASPAMFAPSSAGMRAPDATVVADADAAAPLMQGEPITAADFSAGPPREIPVPVTSPPQPAPVPIAMHSSPEERESTEDFDFGFDAQAASPSSPTATTVMQAPPIPEPSATIVMPAPQIPEPSAPVVMTAPPIPEPSATIVMPAPPIPEPSATTVMPAPPIPEPTLDPMYDTRSEETDLDVAPLADVLDARSLDEVSEAVLLDDMDQPAPNPMAAASALDHLASLSNDSQGDPDATMPGRDHSESEMLTEPRIGEYDVAVSDLGMPPTPSYERSAETDAPAPSMPSADLSPMMRDRIHETLEKVAWEAFADLSDTIVRQVLQRVESTVWEIVPQMAESLIQEEIRRMKGEDE